MIFFTVPFSLERKKNIFFTYVIKSFVVALAAERLSSKIMTFFSFERKNNL